MKKTFKIIYYLILLIFFNQSAFAEFDLNDPMIIDDGHVMLTWTAPDCAIEHPSGFAGHKFQIRYKKVGSLFWDDYSYTNDELEVYDASIFESGNLYKFNVKYYGPNKNCQKRYRERDIGSKYLFYKKLNMNDKAVFHPVQNDGNLKKIRNIGSDKCLYPYTWDGGSISSVRMFQWECTSTDPKAFDITESTIDGEPVVYMKSQTLGLCLAAKDLDINSEVGVASCDSPLVPYTMEPSVVGGFKLKNWFSDSNQCLTVTDSENGSMVVQSKCIAGKKNQAFLFEDF